MGWGGELLSSGKANCNRLVPPCLPINSWWWLNFCGTKVNYGFSRFNILIEFCHGFFCACGLEICNIHIPRACGWTFFFVCLGFFLVWLHTEPTISRLKGRRDGGWRSCLNLGVKPQPLDTSFCVFITQLGSLRSVCKSVFICLSVGTHDDNMCYVCQRLFVCIWCHCKMLCVPI